MSTEKGHTLVPSTNSRRYVLDEPQGYDLTSGQAVSVLLGDCWTQGRVEHASLLYAIERTGQAERGYYFLAHNGTVCGLCAGMQVRLR
jgi:hypothetical protein